MISKYIPVTCKLFPNHYPTRNQLCSTKPNQKPSYDWGRLDQIRARTESYCNLDLHWLHNSSLSGQWKKGPWLFRVRAYTSHLYGDYSMIIVDHYKDPYQTTSVMESIRGFVFRCYHSSSSEIYSFGGIPPSTTGNQVRFRPFNKKRNLNHQKKGAQKCKVSQSGPLRYKWGWHNRRRITPVTRYPCTLDHWYGPRSSI